ncbi:hypothetical protein DF021_31980 [Burkholderia stagnalis]|uniref:Uncharacterized protein n=1 Tax=Burkholderia stagnalis TaxID=1503054 RepID=A0ABX9YFR6_9BURK|nr:hypothetical protein DF158_31765 [Burkholderia stagnalis]RQQ60140.1 hypothetical protein DF137_32310 [Burkholderia stagnalis]RQQ60723.1 hypothetical protein DF139_32115 [Burkholderia stagnalis]RQQ75477.1 hypothetical protein DF138_31685 [Burkholderia stagnalis]RQQ80783.1 hypothetical protein DF134_32505 [Burkholderia stagnalis]
MTYIGEQKMIGEYLAMVVYDAMFDRGCQIDVVASEALIRHSTCDFAHAKVSIMTVKQPLAANCHLFDRFVHQQSCAVQSGRR